MRVYASGTNEARELINELEFVWDQVKGNPDVDVASSAQGRSKYQESIPVGARSGDRDRLRVLRPMSEPEEGELDDNNLPDTYREAGEIEGNGIGRSHSRSRALPGASSWQTRVDRALVQMTAEIAALREVVEARGNRLWRKPVGTRPTSWIGWFMSGLWALTWRVASDALILGLVVLALRWRRGGKEKVAETWRAALQVVARLVARMRRLRGRVKSE